MQFVILDLEWNGAFSKRLKKYINEIIEFGSVKVDSSLKAVDTFSALVKPQIGKKLSGRVTELTHITNDQLKTSKFTYEQVLKQFTDFSCDCVILTWGTTDISTLMDNNEYYFNSKKLGFLKEYINLQAYCQNTMGKADAGKQMGLETAAQLLQIEYGEENLHRALDDSVLSYKCFKKLYDEKTVKEYLRKADNKFYDRIGFKNVVLTDLNNPLIDKNQLNFCCDKCGGAVVTTQPLAVKNKSFRGKFHCNKCNYDFFGKVQFKLKYDGVHIKKATYTPKTDTEKKAVTE